MTTAYRKYTEVMARLLDEGEESEKVDSMLDELDVLWWQMTEDERKSFDDAVLGEEDQD